MMIETTVRLDKAYDPLFIDLIKSVDPVELTPLFSAMQAPASFASETGVARRRRMLLKGIRVEITANPFFSRKGKAEEAAPCHLSWHVMVVCSVLGTTSVV